MATEIVLSHATPYQQNSYLHILSGLFLLFLFINQPNVYYTSFCLNDIPLYRLNSSVISFGLLSNPRCPKTLTVIPILASAIEHCLFSSDFGRLHLSDTYIILGIIYSLSILPFNNIDKIMSLLLLIYVIFYAFMYVNRFLRIQLGAGIFERKLVYMIYIYIYKYIFEH